MTAIGDLVPRYWSQSHCVPPRSLASFKLSFKTYCISASSESKEGGAVACGFANKLADNRERERCCPCTTREPDDVGGWSCPLGLEIAPVDEDERATSLQLLCPVMEVIERADKLMLLLARKAGGVDDVEAGNENDTGTRSPTDADTLRLPLAPFPKGSASARDGCDGICQTFDLPMLSGDTDMPILLEPASVASGLWRGDTCIFVDPAGE